MAQIDLDNFIRVEKQRNNVHQKVPATLSSYTISGEKYVQIDTYGRPGRKKPESNSQSLQLDKEAAERLIGILKQEFGI